MLIHLSRFQGMVPRAGDYILAAFQAQQARNVDLFSGELRPIPALLPVTTPAKTGPLLSIYKLGDYWCHWPLDVDVVPAPLQTDNLRIYYTGDGQPKATDESLVASGSDEKYPNAWYRLGLPAPETAPTVAAGSGAAADVIRSYAYTFVTAWGEESAPSPAGTDTGPSDATWALTGLDTAPPNTTNITAAVHSGGVVTVTTDVSHFLETGDVVTIAGVVGMTDLDGEYTATVTGATTFTVAQATAQTYTSGGTVDREAPIQTTDMVKYIYRTLDGKYKFVAEVAAATTSYNDTTADEDLGELLPSADADEPKLRWLGPPVDLKGLRPLPNGSLLGFRGRTLYFTPPYQPHAWPEAYELTFPFNIIGAEVVGNSVIVATDVDPYIVVGDDPSAMFPQALESFHACLNKRSMVRWGNGVMFAAPEGLVYVPVAGAPQVITSSWLKKRNWELYNPESVHAYVYENRYYGFFTSGGESGNEDGSFVFDPAETDSTFTEIGQQATAGYVIKGTGNMYLLVDDTISQWEAATTKLTFTWKSKKIKLPRPATLKACMVRMTTGAGVTEAEAEAEITAAMAAVDAKVASGELTSDGGFGGSAVGVYSFAGGPYVDAAASVGAIQSATLKVWADGVLVRERQLSGTEIFRIPMDRKAKVFEVELSGTDVTIHDIYLAETMSELARVE